jgi:hypothetical protein
VFIGGNHESSASAAPRSIASRNLTPLTLRTQLHARAALRRLGRARHILPRLQRLHRRRRLANSRSHVHAALSPAPPLPPSAAALLRRAGWSGIFDRRDFQRGHYEQPPFVSPSCLRSELAPHTCADTSAARCTRATT